ncbi:MAG: ABC transporter substrate-binding protein [Firmicutes bacterium]|nr:ABC transporter substrate-binding protein [Bacillota bacterium]
MEKLRLFSFALLASTVMMVVGCTPTTSSSEIVSSSTPVSSEVSSEEVSSEEPVSSSSEEPLEEPSQGVTATTITVGNTAAVSGALAFVGMPFNAGINAVFEEVNDAGGIGGRTINLLNRDDGFNAAVGVANTEKLVEDDQVFALVGHFGTGTVGATLDYIQEMGIPMVYAATGINALYQQKAIGSPVMPVQPIYKTEGRIMLARVLRETDLFGTVDSVGVIYTDDDAGTSIQNGIVAEGYALGVGTGFTISYQKVSAVTGTDYSAAVLALQTAGVDCIIIAANQVPFKAILTQMANSAYEVPVLTSYVNAAATSIPAGGVTAGRPVYANAWVDVFSATAATELGSFAATLAAYSGIDAATATAYAGNSYAIAGYIAAKVFVAGLERVTAEHKGLTWANYIAAMESSAIDFPLGGSIDFTNGKRWGVDQLSLLKFDTTLATPNFISAKPIQSLDEIVG